MFKKINLLYILYLRGKKMLRRGDEDHFAKIDRHSYNVKRMKKRIFRLLIILVICFSAMPFLNITGNSKFNFNTEKGELSGEASLAYDKPVVMNPKYSGLDNNGRPFKLNAKKGISEDKVNVQLEDIDSQITLKDGTLVYVKSKAGSYNVKNKILNLGGGVIIDVSNGYHLETESAVVMTDENMASGTEPVKIQGKTGDLYSKGGFSLKDSGNQIFFHGGVKMMILPDEVRKENEERKAAKAEQKKEEENNKQDKE